MKNMRNILIVLACLLPAFGYAIGGAADTPWPAGGEVEVQLRLLVTSTNRHVNVSGDLLIKNPTDQSVTLQSPHNRLALAFLVFDELGNPIAPTVLGKADPGFQTHILAAHSTRTHHFESLDFITGSVLCGYDLKPGGRYRILAVYRPAGPHGPGFGSREVILDVPQ